MADLTMTRRAQTGHASLTLLDTLRLPLGRVHEFCGPARRTLAVIAAGQMVRQTPGPIFWISPKWDPNQLNPQGIMRFVNPGRITYLSPERAEDLLWCTEECLRSGMVPVVVADLPGPPALTPVRRLHLAAETGGKSSADNILPLGLLLTPGPGGAPGVETRWWLAGRHTPTARGWQLERRRARTAPQKAWHMGVEAGRLTLAPGTLTNP